MDEQEKKSDIEKAKDLVGLVKDLLALIPEVQKLIKEKKKGIEVRDKLNQLLTTALKIWEQWAPLSREKKKEFGDAIDAIIDDVEKELKKIRELAEEAQKLLGEDKTDAAEAKIKEIEAEANKVQGKLTSLDTFQKLDKARREKEKKEK